MLYIDTCQQVDDDFPIEGMEILMNTILSNWILMNLGAYKRRRKYLEVRLRKNFCIIFLRPKTHIILDAKNFFSQIAFEFILVLKA